MPEQSEHVGANMIEYELPDGSHVLVHPDDVEQFEKGLETMQQGANDAAIMQKLREENAGAPAKAAAAPKRVGVVNTDSTDAGAAASEAKAQEPAENKAAKAKE